jgi:hypothetical protein
MLSISVVLFIKEIGGIIYGTTYVQWNKAEITQKDEIGSLGN